MAAGSLAALTTVKPIEIEILTKVIHMGDSSKPEWKKFTSVKPTHRSHYSKKFKVSQPDGTYYLRLESGEVGNSDWEVRINNKELGKLKKGTSKRELSLRIPKGLLKKGTNEFEIRSGRLDKDESNSDDIYVGPVKVLEGDYKANKSPGHVSVRVIDKDTKKSLPCRITVTRFSKSRKKEVLVECSLLEGPNLALRKGILYTSDGSLSFGLPEGSFTIYATRGFEYGLAKWEIKVKKGSRLKQTLELKREVDTTGYVAGDTHVHTETYSGHGDINMEERMVAILGEGVEVAIATDHNHHTDYGPTAKKLGLEGEFFPIIGNEFTTSIGHFNAFPLSKDDKPAPYKSKDWEKLLKGLRKTPGVEMIILNHPRRADAFEFLKLDSRSGEIRNGPQDLGIDAVEVINGKTLHDDPTLTFRDWFALINRGTRLTAVAGSDSHTVKGIVGQARTYIQSSTDDPRKLQMKEVVQSFKEGRILVSLGLFTQIEVAGKYREGDLATDLGAKTQVKVKVSGPSWTQADRIALYLNGQILLVEKIKPSAKPGLKFEKTWNLPKLTHDAHLVAIATGPGVEALYWPLTKDDRYVLGATNPVWLDGDGDNKFTSAYQYAQNIVKAHGLDTKPFRKALDQYDRSVAIQAATIVKDKIETVLNAEFRRLREEAQEKMKDLLFGREDRDKVLEAYLKDSPLTIQ